MNDFSKQIIKIRKKTGLSREKFAAKIGVSGVTVYRWENGLSKPDDSVVKFWLDKILSTFT